MVSFLVVLAGFFKRLFSAKARTGQRERQVGLSAVQGFLQSASASQRKAFDSGIARRFAEIKFLLGQLKASVNALEGKRVETGNLRLGKIAGTSKVQASRQLASLVEKLSPPDLHDLDAIRQYSIESESFLSKEILAFGKNIAYTSIVLKEEMKGIGLIIRELHNNVSELNKSITENRLVFLESVAVQKISRVSENNEKIFVLQNSINAISQEISSKQSFFDSLVAELESMSASEEAGQLSELEEKKVFLVAQRSTLEREIFEKVSVVEKPLRKLARLAEGQKAQVSSAEKKFLQDFLSNPILALKRDPKADYFKAVLRELGKQFDSGNIELKEKELEKKQFFLHELLEFNFFESFFWKSNNIEIELNKIEREIRHNAFLQGKLLKEKQVAGESALLEEKKLFFGAQNAELGKLQESNLVLVKELEFLISNAFPGESIKIVL